MAFEGRLVKEFKVTGNLNRSNAKIIIANITPHIEIKVKLIYSFKSVIYQGGGKIQPYSKTLGSAPGMFTSLKEIQACIEECERKQPDLDNEEVWLIYPSQEQPRYEVIMKTRLFLSMFK